MQKIRGEDNMLGKKILISHQFPTAVGNRWEISHRGGKSMGNFPSRWEIVGKFTNAVEKFTFF